MTDASKPDKNFPILACVDGSLYTDSVCAHAAWASRRLDAPIRVLHLLSPDSDYVGPTDLSGTLGLGAKSTLLEKLTQVDEARGRLELQKGKLILAHAKEQLAGLGIAGEDSDSAIQLLHRRGSLVETITELEGSSQIIVLGKRGEHADFAALHLGTNLERVARAAHRPILVASRTFKAINRFVIAYDGGPSTRKALDFVVSNPLLRGLECHLLKIGSDNNKNQADLETAATQLRQGGFAPQTLLKSGNADAQILSYVKSNQIDLLIMGAYGHSHIRTLIIGSTTTSLLRHCLIPVLLFH